MSGWSSAPLIEVAPPTPSSWCPSPDQDVWLLNLDQIESESGDVLSRRKEKANKVPASTVAFDNTHVLYSKLRPNLNKVVLPSIAGYCTSELLPLKPDSRRLDRRYLAHYLRSRIFVAWAVSRTDGAKMPRVKMDALREHRIPLPELVYQRRIAAILDKADDIRKRRRETLKLADEFLYSLYLEAVTLAKNSGRKPRPFMDLFNFTTGKLDSNAAEAEGAYPFFTCARETYFINSYAFNCEALLLAGNNANGDYSVKHHAGKFNAYQRTYVITLKNENYSYGFFRYALENKLKDLKRFSKGTNTKYLTLGILAEQKLVVPDEDVQERFDIVYGKVNLLKQSLLSHAQIAQEMFSKLCQNAFSTEKPV